MNNSLSLRKTSLRTQLSASYALMAVLPILTMGYLIWSYVDPEILSQNTLLPVVIILVLISLFGFILIRQVINALADFRTHLNTVIEDRVLDTPLSSDLPACQPPQESIEQTVYNLIKHNSRLNDMFSEVEETFWAKTRELTRVNLEMQRQLKKQQETEEQLKKSNVQLSEALARLKEFQEGTIRNERLSALSKLASGIAHDINNALMPVLGFADLILQDEAITHNKLEFERIIREILAGANEAREVADRLRSFYKNNTGLNFANVSCGDLVKTALDLTKPKWAEELPASGIRVSIVSDIPDDLNFAGDAALIRDALVSLIINALDAMPTGGELRIHGSTDGSMVSLSVTDTGTGMNKYVRERCTDLFFTTKGAESTGMGLAVTAGTVNRHSGELNIESTPDRGTTITIKLPVKQKNECITASRRTDSMPRIKPLNILVIDDDERSRTTLKAILDHENHAVDLEATGSAGIKAAGEKEYNLVITDRAMPDLSGDDVAARIKALSPDTPIIMITGFGDIMKEQNQKPAGVDVVISKPVDTWNLLWTIFDLTQ